MSAKHAKKLARRGSTVVVATVALVAFSGTAFAFWTTTGTGSGAAQARTFQAVAIAGGVVTGNTLYPGLTANGSSVGGDLVIVASNPNPFAVSVTVSQAVGAVTGCATPAVTFLGGTFTLAAGDTAVTRTIARSVSMGTTSSSDCQGAAITIPLTTSSQSN